MLKNMEGWENMKAFLCGGGDGAQVESAYKRLNEVIDHSKPCLYIPLAMEPDMYSTNST